MVLLIAHRGLVDGPNQDIENNPRTIEMARELGYDVEIDLWRIFGEWFLGHDAPEYKVSDAWLAEINGSGNHAWIHAKNIDALYGIRLTNWTGHYFYHQNDDVVITSSGFLWTYPGKQLTPLSICVMPEWIDAIDGARDLNVFGFCSDYVNKISKNLA